MQGPDGSVFTGGWNKDVKHGLGRKVYSNGDVYEVRLSRLRLMNNSTTLA